MFREAEYALDMWLDPDIEKDADATEFGSTIEELRQRAEVILAAGRFKALELFRWNANTQGWDSLEEFY